MEALPADELGGYMALGEVALDGALTSVAGVLLAALAAASRGSGVICPAECGGEAAWAGEVEVIAAPSLLAIVNHFKGTQLLPPPEPRLAPSRSAGLDLADVKGQESAKRALEIAAAGGHNLLMVGPPGAGKSMLAARLPGILPPLEPAEALELGMIQSVAGGLRSGGLSRERPFRDPHHSASLAALVGGGPRPRPGEISLAHQGVLFLDELPEFNRAALEALRQPLETGRVSIARAQGHVTYPARFQLIAAMNPCRCGHFAELACGRAPRCAEDYQGRLSGPLLDRIDLHIDVRAVAPADLALPPAAEGSAAVAGRVATARARQAQRYAGVPAERGIRTNAEGGRGTARRNCDPRARRRRAPRSGSRAAAPLGARLPPGIARRPHSGRSRRRAARRPDPYRRGAELSPNEGAAGRRGVASMTSATFAFGSTRFCMPHMRRGAERTVVTIRYPRDAERTRNVIEHQRTGIDCDTGANHAGREWVTFAGNSVLWRSCGGGIRHGRGTAPRLSRWQNRWGRASPYTVRPCSR
jgi:magnesium chelatase family protein